MASERGADSRAVTLLGFAQNLRDSIGLVLPAIHADRHRVCEQVSPERMGSAAFTTAFVRGAAMPEAEAIAFVLEQAPATPTKSSPSTATGQPPGVLTRRELEIAHLITDGLTSQHIAARLFISERTITTRTRNRRSCSGHVTNMLNKLGLSSRIQIASWMTASQTAGTKDA